MKKKLSIPGEPNAKSVVRSYFLTTLFIADLPCEYPYRGSHSRGKDSLTPQEEIFTSFCPD